MASVQELSDRFANIDLTDDVALLAWLQEMFQACDEGHTEVPRRRQIASKIGRARRLLPNPGVPNDPPADYTAEWLLKESLGTLIYSADVDRQADLYGITAFAIHSWLIKQRASS